MRTFDSTALCGETVVIFGGTSGMGLETARLCLACGAARVWITGRNPDRLTSAINFLGGGASGAAFDLADGAAISGFLAPLERVDHVYVPAGNLAWKAVNALSEQEIRAQFEHRVYCIFRIVREVLPKMPDHGSFVLSSGTVLVRPSPGTAHVAAALGAVHGLVPALVGEVRPRRINLIMPGAVDTPLIALAMGGRTQGKIDALARSIPTGRIGTPLDLASAAVWLMSNAYVNGATLVMDGGARWNVCP